MKCRSGLAALRRPAVDEYTDDGENDDQGVGDQLEGGDLIHCFIISIYLAS